jgi:hypothetical protein
MFVSWAKRALQSSEVNTIGSDGFETISEFFSTSEMFILVVILPLPLILFTPSSKDSPNLYFAIMVEDDIQILSNSGA